MKPKQSSPLTGELGINDFVPVAKSKKEDTYNIDLDPLEVKEEVESLFSIIGEALQVKLPCLARLYVIAAEADNG